MESAVVRIVRADEPFGAMRKLKVIIDGVEAGTVDWNKAADFPVDPGGHTVEVKLDWCRSAPYPVNADEGEVIEIDVESSQGKLAIFLNPSRFFRLKRRGI